MAIIPLNKYTLSIGVLEIESAKVEDSKRVISLVKELEKEINFLSREPGEFRISIEEERKFIEDRIQSDKEFLLTAKVGGEVMTSRRSMAI